jgi:thioredoxin 2
LEKFIGGPDLECERWELKVKELLRMSHSPIATINFVCPKCLAVNRVPEERIKDLLVCGRCKTSLAPYHPIELNDANFEKFISKSDLPVIVDFWASWCGPCRAMAPQFEEAARTLAGQVLFAKLNTETNQVANQFQITGIPCLIAFANGREVARQAGLMNSNQIVQWVRSIVR